MGNTVPTFNRHVQHNVYRSVECAQLKYVNIFEYVDEGELDCDSHCLKWTDMNEPKCLNRHSKLQIHKHQYPNEFRDACLDRRVRLDVIMD